VGAGRIGIAATESIRLASSSVVQTLTLTMVFEAGSMPAQ